MFEHLGHIGRTRRFDAAQIERSDHKGDACEHFARVFGQVDVRSVGPPHGSVSGNVHSAEHSILYEFQFYEDPVVGGSVVDPSPLFEETDCGIIEYVLARRGDRRGDISPGFLNGLVHLCSGGDGSAVVFFEFYDVYPYFLFLAVFVKCFRVSELLLKQTVFACSSPVVGNSHAVDVRSPGVVVNSRFGNIRFGFSGVEMEHRSDVRSLAFRKAHPFFYDGDGAFLGRVGDGEIIEARAGSAAAGKVFVDELLHRLAVDGDVAVFIYEDRVILFIEFEPFGGHELFEHVSAGDEVFEEYYTVGTGSLLVVIIIAGELEGSAGDRVVGRFVVLPEFELVIRSVDDGEIAVFERIHGVAFFVNVADGDYSVGVADHREFGIQREIVFGGRSLDHRISTSFEVLDMDHAVAAGRYGHIDFIGIVRRTVYEERHVAERRRVSGAGDLAEFIEVEVAVDALFVAEHPGFFVFVVSDNDVAVGFVGICAVADGLADEDVAVMVDGDRHFGMVFDEVVCAVLFLQRVGAARQVAERDYALTVGGVGIIDEITVERIAEQAERDSGDGNEFPCGAVYVVVDFEHLDVGYLTEGDAGVILMVERSVGKFGIVTEFDGVEQINVVVRRGVGSFAVEGVGSFHIHDRGDRARRIHNERISVGLLAQVDSERGGFRKVGIAGAGGGYPDIVMLRKVIVLGSVQAGNGEIFDL